MNRKLYIDASYYKEGITGLSRFSDELIDQMMIMKEDKKLVLFCFKNQVVNVENNLEIIRINLSISVFTYLTLFFPFVSRWVLKRTFGNSGIIHYHDSIRFPGDIKGFEAVVTIHDIASLVFPQFYVWRAKILKKNGLKRLLKSKAKIIAVSNTTKKDLENLSKGFIGRIDVIGEGVNPNFFIQSSQKFNFSDLIPKEYFLVVGSPHSRKNYKNIYSAFKKFKESSASNYKLVFVGRAVDRYFKENNIFTENFILFKENVSDDDLKSLYYNAFAYVNFSLHEGFGLTILEAMANKCLVIGSITTSVGENIGKEGIVASPLNIHEMADSFAYSVCLNEEKRNKLINEAYQKVLKMNWEVIVTKYYQLFKSIDNG